METQPCYAPLLRDRTWASPPQEVQYSLEQVDVQELLFGTSSEEAEGRC